jgi:hypothetical protein
LRIFEGKRAGVHRYLQMCVQQAAGCIAEIYMQQDRGGLRLRDRTAGREEKKSDTEEAQGAFLHLLIISHALARKPGKKHDGVFPSEA